uniref:Ig-like domain-containing protein n=1 Tax=Caenorhabditis tropicalis TaxID=1561998 RepID=A0A1I7TZ59_9PELO
MPSNEKYMQKSSNYSDRVKTDSGFGVQVMSLTDVQEVDTGSYQCLCYHRVSLIDMIYVFVHGSHIFIPIDFKFVLFDDSKIMVPCITTMFIDNNDIELYANNVLIENASKNYDQRFGYKIDKKIYDVTSFEYVQFECRYREKPQQSAFFVVIQENGSMLHWITTFKWPYVGYSNYIMTCFCMIQAFTSSTFPCINSTSKFNVLAEHVIVRNKRMEIRSRIMYTELEIDRLELEDSGEYLCIATLKGTNATLETRTTLHVAPQMSQIKVIERSPQIMRLHDNKEINLFAKIAIYPTDLDSYHAHWIFRYNSWMEAGTQNVTIIPDRTHKISTTVFKNVDYIVESLSMNSPDETVMNGTYVLSLSLLETVQIVQWKVTIENDRPDVQITVREPFSYIVFNQQLFPRNTHLHVECLSVSKNVVFEKKNSESSQFEEIDKNSLIGVDGSFGTGFILNMILDKNTELRCSSKRNGKISSVTKKIIVAEESPHIVSYIQKNKNASKLEDSKLIYEGNHVQLACVVPIGAVDWDVTWRFFDSTSSKTLSSPIRVESKGHSKQVILELYNVTVGSSGKYACVIEEDGSEELLETAVNVEPTIKPYHTKSDSEHVITVDFDHNFEIDCHIAGSPPPEYVWFKDGKPFTGGVQDGSVLKVSRARVEDAGQFQCCATNRAGSTNYFIQVQVEGAPKRFLIFYCMAVLITGFCLLAVIFWCTN